MSNVKIELISAGVRDLLKDPAIQAECRKQAEMVAMTAGDGYEVEERSYPERNGYVVKPVTKEAIKDNFENNTLLKAARV